MKSIAEPGRPPSTADDGKRGTILVPCVFMLCLMSMLTISIIKTGGIGNSTSASLVERSQTYMAALSGVEIAYRRLVEDKTYTGEQCFPLADGNCTIDITCNALGDDEYEVLAHAAKGQSECVLRTNALCKQWTFNYPMAVGGDMRLRGNSNVMGDMYVEGNISGDNTATVHGDLHLTGHRDVGYDSSGNPINIDGSTIPTIEGDVHTNAPDIDFPEVDLAALRELAVAAGQVYTGSIKLENQSLEGVIYLEDCNGITFIKNVFLHGTLVVDNTQPIDIKLGYLNIRCNDDICPGYAIIAPYSTLRVDPNSRIDVYGMTYVNEMEFHESTVGVLTGPLIVRQGFDTYPNSEFYLQCPKSMAASFYENLIWNENFVEETAFEEIF
jgi:hypothetical protein